MSGDEISSKFNELRDSISNETGVSTSDVELILKRLKLDSALENRIKKGDVMSDITIDRLRIAAGSMPL